MNLINMLKRVIVSVVLVGGVSGCERMCATRIVESMTGGGQLALAIQGNPQGLIEKGRIDAERRVAASDGVGIDAWVIKARPAEGAEPRNATVIVIHPLMMSKTWFFSLGEQLADDG